MAKDIFNTCAWRFGNPNDYKEICNDIAEDLIKQNYLKIPEGSVVLTEKEYTKLKTYETLQKVRDDMGLDYSHGREEGYAKARKETAKEILQAIGDIETGNGLHTYTIMFIYKKVQELAKQYGVELQE